MPWLIRNERLWASPFGRFVTDFGVERLAEGLEIHSSAVYHWIRGATAPKPAHAAIIQRLACEFGTSLTLEQIYQHASDLRPVEQESGATRLRNNRENSAAAALPAGLSEARRLWTKKVRQTEPVESASRGEIAALRRLVHPRRRERARSLAPR
jgi:hypothetical protein